MFLIEIGFEEIPSNNLEKFLENFHLILKKYLTKICLTYLNFKIFLCSTRISIIFYRTLKKKNIYKTIQLKSNDLKFINCYIKRSQEENKDNFAYIKIKQNHKNIQYYILKEEKKKISNKIINSINKIIIKTFLSFYINSIMYWNIKCKKFIRPIKFLNIFCETKKLFYVFYDVKSSEKFFGNKYLNKICYNFPYSKFYEKKLEFFNTIPCFYKRIELIRRKINVILKFYKLFIKHTYFLEKIINNIEYPFLYIGTFIRIINKYNCFLFKTILEINTQNIVFIKQINKNIFKFYIFFIINPIKYLIAKIYINYKKLIISYLNTLIFYTELDKKNYILDNIIKLKNIIFISYLGTYYDKIKRIYFLSKVFLIYFNFKDNKIILLAFFIYKIDLCLITTNKYPLLKGYFCYSYSLYNNIPITVAFSLIEQYETTFYKYNVAKSMCGIILIITNNLDNIVGLFNIKKKQKKNDDLFSLKRFTYKIINNILYNKLNINLIILINLSISSHFNLHNNKKNLNIFSYTYEIIYFITVRFINILQKFVCINKKTYDFTKYLLSYKFSLKIPYLFYKKIRAISKFSNIYNNLNTINIIKRITNFIIHARYVNKIIKKNFLLEFSDINLFFFLKLSFYNILYLLKKKYYYQILELFFFSSYLVNNFCINVLINHNNLFLKTNRFFLLLFYKNIFLLLKSFN